MRFARIEEGQSNPLLSLRKVVGTSRTHLSYKRARWDKLYLFSCIDNLLKGAASQAVENWNRSHRSCPWTPVCKMKKESYDPRSRRSPHHSCPKAFPQAASIPAFGAIAPI